MIPVMLTAEEAVLYREGLVLLLWHMREDLRRKAVPAGDLAVHRKSMAEVERALFTFDACVAQARAQAALEASSGSVH